MGSSLVSEFSPSLAVSPGEVLQEALEERGMTQSQLSERMGRPKKTINEIVNGKAAITPETALQLELVLGIPASFWSKLEATYREVIARADERERMGAWLSWLDQIPLKDLIKRGWISKEKSPLDQLRAALEFFQIASPDQWQRVIESPQVLFRKASTFTSNSAAIAAWLQRGKHQAAGVRCQSYDPAAFKTALDQARQLTLEPDPKVFLPKLQALCAATGVVVLIEKELPGCRVNGATHWLTKDKAIIQLSFRYLKGDILWFTFFHEAGHIVLHPRGEVFLETGKYEGPMEIEANEFAESQLIPPSEFSAFTAQVITRSGVIEFAERIGIAPGIVVGRLQKEHLIPHGGHWESLKVKYKWIKSNDD